MNRSYRLKIEEKLNNGIVNEDILLGCIVTVDKKISKLLYWKKCYENMKYKSSQAEDLEKLEKYIEYRKPFMNVIKKKCKISVSKLKTKLEEFPENKIPTKKYRDKVRELILNGNYTYEE